MKPRYYVSYWTPADGGFDWIIYEGQIETEDDIRAVMQVIGNRDGGLSIPVILNWKRLQ